MNDEEVTYSQIEKYLNKELSVDDRILFENRIASEPDLANQLKEMQEAHLLLLDKFLLDEKEMMKQFEYKSTVDSKNKTSKWWFGGFLLITGVLTLLFLTPQKKESIKATSQTKSTTDIVDLADENSNVAKESIKPVVTEKEKNRVSNIEQSLPPIDSNKQTSALIDSIPLPSITFSSKKEKDQKAGNCDTSTISVLTTRLKPCQELSNGQLTIISISGGSPPYSIKWNNDSTNNDSTLINLKADTYALEITDTNQCQTIEQIILEDSLCETVSKLPDLNLSFSRSFEEGVLLPNFDNQDYHITIITKKGNQVLEKNMFGGEEFLWTGETEQGELPVGYYITIFKVSNQAYKGSITILP